MGSHLVGAAVKTMLTIEDVIIDLTETHVVYDRVKMAALIAASPADEGAAGLLKVGFLIQVEDYEGGD